MGSSEFILQKFFEPVGFRVDGGWLSTVDETAKKHMTSLPLHEFRRRSQPRGDNRSYSLPFIGFACSPDNPWSKQRPGPYAGLRTDPGVVTVGPNSWLHKPSELQSLVEAEHSG